MPAPTRAQIRAPMGAQTAALPSARPRRFVRPAPTKPRFAMTCAPPGKFACPRAARISNAVSRSEAVPVMMTAIAAIPTTPAISRSAVACGLLRGATPRSIVCPASRAKEDRASIDVCLAMVMPIARTAIRVGSSMTINGSADALPDRASATPIAWRSACRAAIPTAMAMANACRRSTRAWRSVMVASSSMQEPTSVSRAPIRNAPAVGHPCANPSPKERAPSVVSTGHAKPRSTALQHSCAWTCGETAARSAFPREVTAPTPPSAPSGRCAPLPGLEVLRRATEAQVRKSCVGPQNESTP